MFHRCCSQQTPATRFQRVASAFAGNWNLMLRQLFISGAVAACELGVLFILSSRRCLERRCRFDEHGQYIKQGVSPESSQLNQVTL
jgi:hypothetical protein